jgi:hypothetical protein
LTVSPDESRVAEVSDCLRAPILQRIQATESTQNLCQADNR